MAEWDDLDKRMERIERLLGNGDGYYVRRETLTLMLDPIREDLKDVRQMVADARNEQREERKALRNIVVGALVSGIVSIIVAITVAAILSG